MKVTTDACLFGAWIVDEINNEQLIINNLLDIGAGTGLLALMLAQKIEADIDCVEIDNEAARQAQENVNASPWKERIFVMPGDAKNMVQTFCKNFDIIVSNPPFYENELRSEIELINLAHHSKKLTLNDVLSLTADHLEPAGHFFLLLPYKRKDEIRNLFKDHQLHISKIVFVRPSVKHDYSRIMLKGKLRTKSGDETEIEEMSIWDDQQRYSPKFVDLLKDYYLYL